MYMCVCGVPFANCASNVVQEPRPTVVQVGNMQDFRAQQVARQPDCKGAQLIFPAITIFDVVRQAPRFLESLIPEGVKALTATCTQLRQEICASVTTIHDKLSGHSHAVYIQVAKPGHGCYQHHSHP